MTTCSFCAATNADREIVAGKTAAICSMCVCLCLDKLTHNNDVRNAILAAVNLSVTIRTEPVPDGALLLELEAV